MNIESDRPVPPAAASDPLSADGGRTGKGLTSPTALHARLLRVSQLATIGEIAAGVAHELNQPLTAITNYAQACCRMLQRSDADQSELQQALEQVAAEAGRAAEIIRRLRMLARGREGTRASMNVNAVIKEVVSLVTGDARAQDVQLCLHLTEPLPNIHADAAQIQHVILNLVRNSLEALSPPASSAQLLIRTALTDRAEVEISVIDNGPGLSSKAMQRMFDPFFSTKEQGTGLGLAMSRTIVRAHGGTLQYRPNQPVGAGFHILLPVQSSP